MVNSPQSSRNTGALGKSLFPNIGVGSDIKKPSFFAENTLTASGENNIQIKKKEKAGVSHYLIAGAIVAGLIYFASTKLD
jgi:hypothetical protein